MQVEMPQLLRARMRKTLAKAGRCETGGVLMAEQLEPGMFRIMDYSIDPEVGGKAHFVRSPEHHAVVLNEFFRTTGNDFARYNYLGEWHSHPNHRAVPSAADIAAMHDLVHGERDIPFALLLVVRNSWWGKFQSSALCFQRGIAPMNVKLINTW